ncbi:MAG: tetratricopeptide repeat protein [Planctomycetes bacterium]|nr:tetratricopeptide repeat protein [Planctomycetota bacterium]
MTVLDYAIFISGLIIALAIVVRYMYWSVEQDGKDLARLESDDAYRAACIARLDAAVLAGTAGPKEFRLRADLRRFEGDWGGVADDLDVYLKRRPKDDTAWYELAEALRETGKYAEALPAAEKACALDPQYIDYQKMKMGCAIIAGDLEAALIASGAWHDLIENSLEQPKSYRTYLGWLPRSNPEDDPDFPLYNAALALAKGSVAGAESWLDNAESLGVFEREDLAGDPVLEKLLELDWAARLR